MESAEARRKRLKALSQSAADAGEGGGLGPAGGGTGGLANPFADEGGTATNSGPFNFYRWGCSRFGTSTGSVALRGSGHQTDVCEVTARRGGMCV